MAFYGKYSVESMLPERRWCPILKGCGSPAKTIHEKYNEAELLLFVRFGVISWIFPIPQAKRREPN